MKKTYVFSSVVLIVVFVLFLSSSFGTSKSSEPSIQYVVTSSDTVQDMLWLADVNKSDIVYDLGSGDGRIVIAAVRDFNAQKAVGIEIDPNLINESRKNAQKAGVTNKVKFIESDLFTSDFSEASVVNLFIGHGPNIKLRPKLINTLKPGTRIVSHQFGMGEWREDKSLMVRTDYLGMWATIWSPFKGNSRVPDYNGNELTPHEGDKIFMWVVPAPVAGIWHGEIKTENGPRELKLILHQRLSEVSGTFELSGDNKLEGYARVDLWGSNIRLWCSPYNSPYGQKELRFDGQVHENTMSGKVIITEEDKNKEYEWITKREKVDYTGTWAWPCVTGDRSVKMHIERKNGKLIAKYEDNLKGQNTILPVTDFYDFGGGFYFTLLIGGTANGGLVMSKESGWLIGEAVLEDGSMKGRTDFFSVGETPFPPVEAISERFKSNLIEKENKNRPE